MGLCLTAQLEDYEDIERYDDGETLLCFRHGEGTYLYANGDMYKGQWKWGMKHGHGVYTHGNGEIKQGYFYRNEYIGQDPGNLFAATSCFTGCFGSNSDTPLVSDEQIREEIRNQERLEALRNIAEQKAKRGEERQRRKDQMRQRNKIRENQAAFTKL